MSTVELRNIISQYISTADAKVLKIVKAVFESYKQDDVDLYDNLPKEIQELLTISKQQAKEGKLTPHKEVMAKYRKKYNVAG